MNKNIKRWIISSVVTFLGGFAAVLVVDIGNITLDTLSDGGLAGIIFVAVRGGVKALLELFILKTRE